MEAYERIAAKLADNEAELLLLRDELAAADAQLRTEQATASAARADAQKNRERHDMVKRNYLTQNAERAEADERLRTIERQRDLLQHRLDAAERALALGSQRDARLAQLEDGFVEMTKFTRTARSAARSADATTRHIRAQQMELLAQVERLEAAAAVTAASARRANARAAEARRAAAEASERAKASACMALFFKSQDGRTQQAAEALRAQLAEAHATRERLEASLAEALEREAQHLRVAAGSSRANLLLKEEIQAMHADQTARAATESVLALELRALEAEVGACAQREASWRALRAQLNDAQAEVRMQAAASVEEAGALQLSVALQRDAARKALAEKEAELEALTARSEALEENGKKQLELVKELSAMLHAAQQQLVGGVGQASGGCGGASRSDTTTAAQQQTPPAPRGRDASSSAPVPVAELVAREPTHQPASLHGILNGYFDDATPRQRQQQQRGGDNNGDTPRLGARPACAVHKADAGAALFAPPRAIPRTPLSCGCCTEDQLGGASTFAPQQQPPGYPLGATAAGGARWGEHPQGQPEVQPPRALTARFGDSATQRGKAPTARRSSLEAQPSERLLAAPQAQVTCPACDDDLYGNRITCTKCLREFHSHCARSAVDGRASLPARWTCPDCSAAKGTTSSSHEPVPKRARGGRM